MKKPLKIALIVLGFLVVNGIGLAFWGFYVEPARLVVTNYQLKANVWEKAPKKLRIAAISDIHGGSAFIDKEKIDSVVELANAQEPDLIVLLGDYVSQTGASGGSIRDRPLKMPIEEIAKGLGNLKAKYGVFAVIGNHDDWYDREKVRKSLEGAGITVLVNEIQTVGIEDNKLAILGLEDYLSIRDWREYNRKLRAIVDDKIDAGDPLIVLAHNPDSGATISGRPLGIANNISVFFAGHTHGGQVWLPIFGRPIVPSNFEEKYAAGVIQDRFPFFVTTGIGTSIAPLRFMVPPEVSVVEVSSE